MNKQVINVYGPPGSGKTAKLTQQFIASAKAAGGPERVAGVTYTRAAAHELRTRVAAAFGMTGTPEQLRKRLPYIGTIHSIAYHALGRPKVVDQTALAEWSGTTESTGGGDPSGWWDPVDNPDASESFLAIKANNMAAQRCTLLIEAIPLLPDYVFNVTTPERIRARANEYRQWKKERGEMDYDDLLIAAQHVQLPVMALVADEAQDNTPLLWRVLDRWTEHLPLSVFVGDPMQALYAYNGADPRHFLSRPGKWVVLPHSYRLTDKSAQYAKRVLKQGGWRDEKIDQWRGAGDGQWRDSSELYLARTHALVKEHIERKFIDTGTPYVMLSGKSPIQTRAADLYRMLTKIDQGGVVDAAALVDVLKSAGQKNLHLQQLYLTLRPLSRNEGYPITLEDIGGLHEVNQAKRCVPWSTYFRQVEKHHGVDALFDTPKIRVGVIHQAKGLEADVVTVLDSWGKVPGAELASGEGSRTEALVAYVAASRHRVKLIVEPTADNAYPWP